MAGTGGPDLESRPDVHSRFVADLYGELALAGDALDHGAAGDAALGGRASARRSAGSRVLEAAGPVWPGVAVCGTGAAAAAWFASHYGVPIILMGLVIGLALNWVTADGRTHRGLDLLSRHGLRAGIVLLGLNVTLGQIGALGLPSLLALLVVMAGAVAAGIGAARAIGQGSAVGVLAGGATAVCGASAALALYGVLGRERLDPAQFTLTVVGISAASALAMVFYPMLATTLALDARQAGFLVGASIHDVAQALGAGYAVSDAAGATATVVKLTRVALLAPIVTAVALLLRRSGQPGPGERVPLLPPFLLGFFALMLANSFLPIPPVVAAAGLALSKALLLVAVTAAAMRTRTDLLVQLGWRALVPVAAATLASLLLALAMTLTVLG